VVQELLQPQVHATGWASYPRAAAATNTTSSATTSTAAAAASTTNPATPAAVHATAHRSSTQQLIHRCRQLKRHDDPPPFAAPLLSCQRCYVRPITGGLCSGSAGGRQYTTATAAGTADNAAATAACA